MIALLSIIGTPGPPFELLGEEGALSSVIGDNGPERQGDNGCCD